MGNEVTTDSVRVWREQGLIATVHRACSHCGAPGKYLTNDYVRTEWPECYVTVMDERNDQTVGTHCPRCKNLRNPSLVQHLGEIWRKRFT